MIAIVIAQYADARTDIVLVSFPMSLPGCPVG